MTSSLFSELILPNGVRLPNRLAKAATEENMADTSQLPGAAICGLYRTWAEGGAGLLITGNVMVDKRALAGPGCVVLDTDTPLGPFTQWAQAARLNGAQVWMQISHPGRQVRAAMKGEAWAPSAIALDMGKHSNRFPLPKAMSESDVEETVARFVATACAAERAGFDGVELHAAHGYLISQFLSPLSNQRVDSWGGSLKNRSRFLLEIVRTIRVRVSRKFCVAVKLNSTDFQRGGFSEAESAQVILWLNELGVDLLEISGGNYESPAKGRSVEGKTTVREAYFMKFATQVASIAQMPVMLTGGIGRLAIAEQALANGVSVVGMATALAIVPDLPAQWRAGNEVAATSPVVSLKDPTLARVAGLALIKRRLRAIAAGKAKPRSYSPVFTLVAEELRTYRLTRRYRRWRAKLGTGRAL